VVSAVWSRADGNIYLKAEDRERVVLFRYDVATASFSPIAAECDVVQEISFASNAPVAAVSGTAPWVPERLAVADLRTGAARLVHEPAGSWFAGMRKGTVEPWSFVSSGGRTLDGRIYLPPGFDPARPGKVPAIVYYYGGTSPVSRDFGGRYPKEWWAAQGYAVYVLQPSGATGFGQAFSALHVNDWGEITSGEVIEGTRKFLDAHPYVDAKRVGCIGASFGGFLTELIVTKTDLFAAAVSHAGISSISSYWGEGYWGYSYSALATAGSFPWDRKDIYVDRSPLFHADKVRTPLLLTHGSADTNVPPGESASFYAALKLLGVPVEYVQIEGMDHLIVDHAKRLVWSRTIVGWFDRWLKGRPEAWDALYPKPK
jgi:dipeptidyl aminopeptidase/acylaminoacyl peptidase